MRKKIIIGNWKMHKTIHEAAEFVNEILPFVTECYKKDVVVGIAPAYLALPAVKKISQNMLIAAQNCHYEPKGAFTGDVSIPMLQEIGVEFCLVGHSERRLYSAETNQSCNKKIHALLANKMTPIYCVGESLTEYEKGLSKEVVKQQIVEGLAGVGANNISQIVFAYEPVWSIGTGKNASTEIAESICSFIRTTIAEMYGEIIANQVLIQYGGSVKADNSHEYLHCPNIDGVLVGGASLEVASFKKLIEGAF